MADGADSTFTGRKTLVNRDHSPELTQARAHYQVPPAPTVLEAVALLQSWGAEAMPVGTQEGNLFDEYVEESLVVFQASIRDPDFIHSHLTDADTVLSPDPDVDDQDDADRQWTAMAEELSTGQAILVILERDRRVPLLVGNFRVHGAGQWVREALWAATGVVPRDSAGASCALFAQVWTSEHPDGGTRAVPLYEKLGRHWPTYVRLMRPWWRWSRRQHLVGPRGQD